MVPTALLIFLLRVTDVSLGTVRMILTIRGYRPWAALIGFVEITIWVVAISRVITNLNNVWNILGYSGGFAVGTLLGMWIEQRLAMGYANLTVISQDRGKQIAEEVRKAGYGATEVEAAGITGPVNLINIVSSRREIATVLALVNRIDAQSFVKVDEPQRVIRGYWGVIK